MPKETMAFCLSVRGKVKRDYAPQYRDAQEWNIISANPESFIREGGGYRACIEGENGTVYEVRIEVTELQPSRSADGYYDSQQLAVKTKK
jgi:hypothetical protein